MSRLRENVEKYVQSSLSNYESLQVRATKVIHDTILGSNLFYPHEIAVLDLPLLQRLRRINQVDVVTLVFPSGNHNRFEHTLGVAVIGEKLVTALFRKVYEGSCSVEIGHDHKYVFNHVRMAAILHDCGHGPFSHISEQVYKHCDDLAYEKENNPRLEGASAHEILSYLIVTSNSFKEFFKAKIQDQYQVEIDLDAVGEMDSRLFVTIQ